MKNLKIYALYLCAAALLTGCSNEEPNAQPPTKEIEHVSDPNFIPIDEALANADKMFSNIGIKPTRANHRIKSIERFKSPTRSMDNDMHGLYVVNYENDGGFALLSADRRLYPVYALSEEGSLHLSDTLDNKGLSWYLNDYITSGGFTPVNPPTIDSLTHTIQPIYDETTVHSTPLLNEFLRKFHQSYPYNQYLPIPNEKDKYYAVGCMPIAVGTIVGYYEWPNNIDGFTMPWESMRTNPYHSQWSRLFALVGGSKYIGVTYGETSTPGVFEFYTRTFTNLKYNGTKLGSLNYTTLFSELKNGHPVIFDGRVPNNQHDGHAFIVDGAYTHKYETPLVTEDGKTVYATEHFVHCLWGWQRGSSNGYYLIDGSVGGKCTTFDEPGPYNPSAPAYNSIRMCYGYRPNK